MSISASAPEAPYERLLELLDQLSSDPDLPINADTERILEQFVIDAMADRSIDRELHLPDVVRWLIALVQGHRSIRLSHPEVDPDDELALKRVLITRWLHPARRDA